MWNHPSGESKQRRSKIKRSNLIRKAGLKTKNKILLFRDNMELIFSKQNPVLKSRRVIKTIKKKKKEPDSTINFDLIQELSPLNLNNDIKSLLSKNDTIKKETKDELNSDQKNKSKDEELRLADEQNIDNILSQYFEDKMDFNSADQLETLKFEYPSSTFFDFSKVYLYICHNISI